MYWEKGPEKSEHQILENYKAKQKGLESWKLLKNYKHKIYINWFTF
jgi:hypothetical protein